MNALIGNSAATVGHVSPSSEVVCTLTSPGYWEGTGVLINSLYRVGFRGSMLIGHLGPREGWATQPILAELTTGIQLHFEEIDFAGHATYYKPDLMLTVLERMHAEKVYFFDSDIVVLADWTFFSRWAQHAVALCQDINHVSMTPTHPLRYEWAAILKERGHPTRDVFGFANGGFVGVRRGHEEFLHIWRDLMQMVPEVKGGYDAPLQGPFWSPFNAGDQDFLNMAAMGSDVPISMSGLEGMNFTPGLGFMAHAVGSNKPWSANVLRDVIVRGRRPRVAIKQFWQAADRPIQVYSSGRIRRQQAKIHMASLLGRFIGS